MTFSAAVIGKAWRNGQLFVELEYTDGDRLFRDTMVSRSGQGSDWVQREVARRLRDLTKLDELADSIQLGKVDISEDTPTVDPASEKEVYRIKLRLFEHFVSVLAKGFSTQDNQDFVDLKLWLTDNFKTEYLDLF